MKVNEIMNDLFSLAYRQDFIDTCDTCKAGNPETDVEKVAVTMFATPDVIRQAADWGAQLLITHEPTYHTIEDVASDERVDREKRELLEKSGMILFRFHDHPHYTSPDLISAGELEKLGLEGEMEYTEFFDCSRLHLKTPVTPVELAGIIEKRFGIRHPRICGVRDLPCQVITGMFGAPGNSGVLEELQRKESEIVLVGETCEWLVGEYVRDAAQLGHKKALIIMGHVGSERDGMEYIARLLKKRQPCLEVKYFDCGEVYTYSDSGIRQ